MWGVPYLVLWIGTAVVAAVVAGAVAWQSQMPSSPPPGPPSVSQPAETSAQPAQSPDPTRHLANGDTVGSATTPPVQPSAIANGEKSVPNAAASDSIKAPAILPQFDVVRVEPDGSAVIAGRAEPNGLVLLLDQGQEVDRVTADTAGQFTLVPKQLGQGDHQLSLRTIGKENALESHQNVTVWIPSASKGEVLVALTSPGEPTRILSDEGKPSTARSNSAGAAPDIVRIRSAEVESLGSFFASGVAPAGAKILLYLNNSYVATVTAGLDSVWSLKIEKGMKPGLYSIRADQVEGANGKVIARAEAPFNYPPASRLAQNQPDLPQTLLSTPAPAKPLAPGKTPASAITPASPKTPAPANKQSPNSAQPVLATPALSATSVPPAPEPPQAPLAVINAGHPNRDKQRQGSTLAGAVDHPDLPNGLALYQAAPAGEQQGSSPKQRPASSVSKALQVPNNILAIAPDADAKANAVVKELGTTIVERGDSLWRISRKVYGRGMRYTQIYEANAVQIRNPALIYPGQIFVVPSSITN